MKKILHKVSHFIKKEKGCILDVCTRTELIHESLKRGLFLADVDYNEYVYSSLTINNLIPIYHLVLNFKTYNQLKFIIPIINEMMIKLEVVTKEYDFYYVDVKCKEYFNNGY